MGQEGFVFVFLHDLGKVLGQGGQHEKRLSGDGLSRCTPFRCRLSVKALLWARRLDPSGWAIVEGGRGTEFAGAIAEGLMEGWINSSNSKSLDL